MNFRHRDLSKGRWAQLSFLEQIANIGSEVSRALNWRKKNNEAYCQKAVDRALELVDLTLASVEGFACRKELARLREALVDYFCGANEFLSTENSWRKYFDHFNFAIRKDR
jgi:hypothetical protein